MKARIPFIAVSAVLLLAGLSTETLAQPKQRSAHLLSTALAAGESGDWDRAQTIAAGIDEGISLDIVNWTRLRDGQGDWEEYHEFLDHNADWPGLATLRRASEFRMPLGLPPAEVIAWFADNPPQTGFGALRLSDALATSGNDEAAEAAVTHAWLEFPMSAPERDAIRDRWPEMVARHATDRLDMLLWEGNLNEAEAIMPLVDSDWQALAKARIGTRRDEAGLQQLIWNVPKKLRNNPGLAYERYLYRTNKGRWDDAEDYILESSTSAETLGRPDMWMPRRANLSRQALRDGHVEKAYAIAAQNFGGSGWPYADSEWMAGFIALNYQDDAARAVVHFKRFRDAVATPISVGRAGYWLGLAEEKAGNTEAALAAFELAAANQTSFYGQLAAEHANLATDMGLVGNRTPIDWTKAEFAGSNVALAARKLFQAGYETRALQFLSHLADGQPAEVRAGVAQMAADGFAPHFGVRIAKEAAADGIILINQYYPLHPIADVTWDVPTEFALAIARQESEMNPAAQSHVGASGLMQLMPATAAQVAAGLSLTYSSDMLTTDYMYNAKLGTEYLRRMLSRYNGSFVLAAAAYNAGPGRADSWIEEYGDPRTAGVDPVVWIESIPYSETRNYVQRVLEGMQVYHLRLQDTENPIRLTSVLLKTG